MAEPIVRQERGLHRARGVRWLAAFLFALGAGVLVGWFLGLESLTRVLPGLVTMKPNTALGFLLAGLALGSLRDGRPSGPRALGFSLAVAMIGSLTLLEYLAGVDLWIDELIAQEPAGSVGSLHPGRMHPTTALDFFLLGIALVLVAVDRGHRAAQWLALLAAFIAGATLIGYLFGVREFEGVAMFGQMALHTTLGMLAASAGLLAASSGRGMMVPIADDGPSGLMARWLLPVAILTPIAATGLTILAREAGLFDERYGAAVRVSVVIAVFVACIWRSAASLHRIDLERRRADSERLQEQERFRFLAESIPQIVWISHAEGELEYLNRRWFDYTGQDPADGWEWQSVLHPDDLGPCLELWERARLSSMVFQGEYRFRRRDGAYRWHLARAEPMRDGSGRLVQWVGTSTDVDDQKRVEEDLRQAYASLEDRVVERTAELSVANDDLRKGEQRFRTLADSIPQLAWMARPDGSIFWYNKRWYDYTGTTLEQMEGWGWQSVHDPVELPRVVETIKTSFASGEPWDCTFPLRRHDGAFRWHLSRMLPVKDEQGRVVLWFGSNTDVDAQKQTEEALRKAKEAAEAATRAKAEFLANMSHEIRTPMNGVLGMTELALATDLAPRQREYLGLVKSSADALLTVIDEILDFSKIEAGKLALEPIPFPPRDVLTDTLRCMALKAHEKGLELACRIAPEVPESVVGDPGRLRQVLVNLVGNAIKFTERGEVVVTVEPDPDETPGAALRFSVLDTGIGIPAEKLASIFNPFEQADGSTTRKYGGTGLGLTISARLIALMGGRIWVEENPEGGSIFRFTARLDREFEGLPDRPSAGTIVLEGLRILIVDDNRTNRMILEEILSQWGCRPSAVEGAAEALEVMGRAADRGEPFPLVLLDLMMPEVDGCLLAGRLRADPRHVGVRLMMLTSGGTDDASRSVELGIGAWLAKPIRQSELLDAILDLMGPGPATAITPVEPAPPPRVRPLRVLLAEDHPINQKVATRMLQDQGHEVTVVGNGRLAVEALASGPFDAVLMDLAMPEMGGFEALEAIRLRERLVGSHMPVVALTAHAMAGDRERCLAAGFDGYLAKPVQAARLAEALAGVVGNGDRVAQAPGPAVPPPDERPAFDFEAALNGLDGDEPLLVEILGLFLEDAPRLLAEARLAIEAGDAPTLMRMGHTLAGSAAHFAAQGLVAAARALEATGKADDLSAAEPAALAFAEEFDRFQRAASEALMTDRASIRG